MRADGEAHICHQGTASCHQYPSPMLASPPLTHTVQSSPTCVDRSRCVGCTRLIGWATRGKRENELECGPMGSRTFATKEWPHAINTHRQCSRAEHAQNSPTQDHAGGASRHSIAVGNAWRDRVNSCITVLEPIIYLCLTTIHGRHSRLAAILVTHGPRLS